ncbi:MAG: hypothetical protein V1870_03570 [Candidatus Aenigmatarchaeota archaeon]
MNQIQKLKKLHKKELIKELSKQHIKDVRFHGHNLSLKFLGHRLKFVVVFKHVGMIGNWNRKRNTIYIEAKLRQKDRLPIIIHEAVERFVTKHFGLRVDSQSHPIAQSIEKHFIRNKHLWREHEDRVNYLWKKQREHDHKE